MLLCRIVLYRTNGGVLELDENKAREFSLKVMETAWEVYLTTIDENGFPAARAMDNLRNKMRFPKLNELFKRHSDDFRVLMATFTSSAKMRHIRKNPAVCVYYCEPLQFHGVALNGKVEIVKDAELKHALWHDYWAQYYWPKGVNDPEYTVLSLYPMRAKGYHGGSGRFKFTLK